jgi:hypothetical protein
MKQHAGRSDDIPHCSTLKADYDSDIFTCSNLDMNLRAQLESTSTNGKCTNKLIEKLINVVLKLSDEIRILWKDNENLDIKLDYISATKCCFRLTTILGATYHGTLPPAAEIKEPISYRNVLTAGSTSSISY